MTGGTQVVLAVSGGPDSLALMAIAGDHRQAFARLGFHFHVVTVDHGLREASAAEARQVGRVAAALGLPYEICRWDGVKRVSNIQAEARAARYALLITVARRLGAPAIVTAHHEDDQVETHLLAAQRRAGDRGLAGMRAMREMAPGIHLLRPFLNVPGAGLKARARALAFHPADDPNNYNMRYERIRLRQALASGAIDRATVLAAIRGHAARRDADDRRLACSMRQLFRTGSLRVDAFGLVRLSRGAFGRLDQDRAIQLLARIVPAVGGAAYPPRRAALERLAERLRDPGDGAVAATLGGAALTGASTIVFQREYGRKGPDRQTLREGEETEFDRRFAVALDPQTPGALDAVRGMMLMPFGAFGRGTVVERTLPVLVTSTGRLVGAPSSLGHKVPDITYRLLLRERISWRLRVDLPCLDLTKLEDCKIVEAG